MRKILKSFLAIIITLSMVCSYTEIKAVEDDTNEEIITSQVPSNDEVKEEAKQEETVVETDNNQENTPKEEKSIQTKDTRVATSITYRSHVQDFGWETDWRTNGDLSGRVGVSKSMEAIQIKLANSGVSGSVEYKTHIQDFGWETNWAKDGATSGTVGRAKRIEAIQIQLTGELADNYDIYYRVHSSNVGWLSWAKNGETAGTEGWNFGVEGIQIMLVGQNENGPESGTSFIPTPEPVITQVDETTEALIDYENINQLKQAGFVDNVEIIASMNYGNTITREIKDSKSIESISESGYKIDFGDYGKFKVTIKLKKGDHVFRTIDKTMGITASEYNLAPLDATFPVVYFSLSIWDINQTTDGKTIPTIVMLGRPRAYNWDKLPEGVYSLPYMSKTNIAPDGDYTAFAAYVKDLYEVSPKSKFNLYINDITCSIIHDMIYSNKIPEGQYTIKMFTDGGRTYNIINTAYAVANPEEKHQQLINSWNQAKAYAYANGRNADGWGWHSHWDSIYAILDCEPTAEWWVPRNNLFTSGDNNEFAKKIAADVKKVGVNDLLTALTNKGPETVEAFKNLYDFNDGYFNDAQEQNKKAMVLLGTYVFNEKNFEDYTNLTKLYYGDEYLYYYKGHPNTPTEIYPDKLKQLEALGVKDIDSNVAAELILFFNPEMSLSGYGSSTYNSASDEMACGLFGTSKNQALAGQSQIDYTGMDWFATPITIANDSEIIALCDMNNSNYLLELSDEILSKVDYDLGIYNATKDTIKYYEKTADGYKLVSTKGNSTDITYSSHVAELGWGSEVKENSITGTTGRGLAMEAFKATLGDLDGDVSLEYRAHVANIGWQNYVKEGQVAGTVGQSRQMEAISMRLTGANKDDYDIYYRTHVQDYGWLDWAKDGQDAGTVGYSKRIEAVQVQIVKKGEQAPTNTANHVIKSQFTYTTHIQNIGWQANLPEGSISGTVGSALRLEGIKIALSNQDYTGSIRYKTHVQDLGWQGWVANGSLSGTTGLAKRLEAIQIELTDNLASNYDIYYRVHVQDYGWLGWAKNGENAGTEGLSKRMEAIQIQLVTKGGEAPGSTGTKFIKA